MADKAIFKIVKLQYVQNCLTNFGDIKLIAKLQSTNTGAGFYM